MKTLVTGAGGLYGVNMVHALLQMEDVTKVIGIDDFAHREYPINPPFLEHDIEDPRFEILKMDFRKLDAGMIKQMDLDVLIHFAALVSVPESMLPEMSQQYYDINETGTFMLMQQLVKIDKQKWPLLIYASSGKVYGKPTSSIITLKAPNDPGNVYGATKLAAEKHCMVWHHAIDYPVIAVRNFNTYGENQNPFLKDAAVVTTFIQQALNNEPITVHGDGSQSRDFNYVGDAVMAYAAICSKWYHGNDKERRKLSGSVFNLASGRSTSMNELAETIIRLTGSRSVIEHNDVRQVDMMQMVGDSSKLQRETGWKPRYSLEEGLRRSIDWYEGVMRLKVA